MARGSRYALAAAAVSACLCIALSTAASEDPVHVYDINLFATWKTVKGGVYAPRLAPLDGFAANVSYSGDNLPALTNSERLWWPASSAQPASATTFHVCAWTGADIETESLTLDKKLHFVLSLTVRRGGEEVELTDRWMYGADMALQMKLLQKDNTDCGPYSPGYVGTYSYRPASERPAGGAPWLELELSWEAAPEDGQVRLAQTVRGADGQAYEVASDPGRLLVYQDGAWGSVCGARVQPALVCAQLGYSYAGGLGGEAFTDAGADAASPILADGITCASGATSFSLCEMSYTASPNCTHDEDVWISCASMIVRGDYEWDNDPPSAQDPPSQIFWEASPPIGAPPSEPGAPPSPPALPALSEFWTHSCSLVLTPQVQTLSCEAAGPHSGNLTVAIGGALVGRLRVGPGITVTTREPVLPYKRYTDSTLTEVADEVKASADVGVTFVGVPHLRLVDSVVRGLQLSTGGPLVQCLDCAFLTMDNVTVQDLRGYRLTEDYPQRAYWIDAANLKGLTGFAEDDWWGRNGPLRLTHGPIHATGLKGATIKDFSCSSVNAANGWGCVLLRLSETLGSYPVRIANSSFTGVDVHWAGAYGTMSDANVEGTALLLRDNYSAMPMGFGAVVVDAGRPGVVADVQVTNSSFSGLTGGLGHAIALLNRATSSESTISLEGVSFRACSPSMYGAHTVYVLGSVNLFNATNTQFTGCDYGLVGVTQLAARIVLDKTAMTGNQGNFEPSLFHVGGLGGLEISECNITNNDALDVPAILVDRMQTFAFREDPDPIDNITITSSVISSNVGGFLAADQRISKITVRDSVIADNAGKDGGVFQLSRPTTGVDQVLIDGCQVTNNFAAGDHWDDPKAGDAYDGALLHTYFLGRLTLNNSAVINNTASGSGGAVSVGKGNAALLASAAEIYVINSLVVGNRANVSGGVVAAAGDAILSVAQSSQVLSNHAARGGGVLYAAGTAQAVEVDSSSAVALNTAGRKGGVLEAWDLSSCVVEGEVAANSARQGAAFHVAGGLQSLRVTGGGVFRDNTPTTPLGGSIWVGEELGSLALEAGSSVSGSLGSLEGVAELTEVAAAGASAELRECTSVCHTRPPMPPSPPVYGGEGMPPTYGGDMPPAYGGDSMPPPRANDQEGAPPSLKSRRLRI
ncbi:hypothetical protein HYH03_012951 [Edaphochlamys debaryana]|uniref:SRCR domain-containing protein n=1 Tax=Edaphochlamys debaryana TaxID=47281 RepID=A0A835XRJ3_9CHLO|nr:hypothetical protein HYH03_012951 [Edaphochlamys debaryana]|eukprot:KAG2488444.1 hypothetical protein HYH03_012951 [Edaphochlamys debaryana]